MPKGFLEDGTPILTKDEFMEAILKPRGYEKDINGNWILIHNEDNPTKKVNNLAKRAKEKIRKEISSKNENNSFNKEIILNKIKEVLEESYTITLEGTSIFIVFESGMYELKITRKSKPFEFDTDLLSIKDICKKQVIRLMKTLTFCNVGIVDSKKGVFGFTDGKSYFTVTITRKRT